MPDTPLPEAELKRVEEYCEKATAARHLKSMMEAVYSLPKFDRDFIFAARTDLPALVAEVRRLRADLEHRNTEFRELSDVNDELQADLEQAAKDYVVAKKEAFRISDWPDPDWLKRVREREGKNG